MLNKDNDMTVGTRPAPTWLVSRVMTNRLTTAVLAAAAVLLLAPVAGQAKPAESWSAASPTFQSQTTKDQWAAAALPGAWATWQAPEADADERAAHEQPPGVPPGDYSVLVYATDFEKRSVATETAILTRDADSKWRTSGYFIK